MRKALVCLVLALVPVLLAATAVAASTPGVSVSGPTCGDDTNADSQIVGQPAAFVYKVANTSSRLQATDLVFQLPSRAAAAEPAMTLGRLLSGDCNNDPLKASPFRAGAPRCQLTSTTVDGKFQRWTCSSMTIPAGKWRLISISFHKGFGQPGRFPTSFWARPDSGPTKPVKTIASIVPS